MAKIFLRSPATLRWLITIHFQVIAEPIMYHQVIPEKHGQPWKTWENVEDYICFSKSIFFQTLVSIWTGAFLAFAASHCLNLNPFAQFHCPWALEHPQSSPGPVSAPCPAAGHATERSSWESRRPASSPAEQRGCSIHQYENGFQMEMHQQKFICFHYFLFMFKK